TMLSQFEEEAATIPWGNAKQLGLSPYEVVVLASLIEKEAANDAERAKIASVIYNRLKSKTPLYIDATLNYIDPDPSNGLTESDLKIKSPYNTRLVKGLPPTPIASPGRASLMGALKPASTNYMYYVLCGDSHRFTSSYNEFLTWKDQCL
ncbi:MAG: endolytic transglycosylase MltG, partial [Actinobacteria bacterium]|nr:endolytic transglycosylase MltG [Actinomycetota bacterium]